MKKVFRIIGIVLGSIIGMILVAGVVLYFMGTARLNRSYNIQVENVPIPTDEQSIARGRHLAAAVTLCQVCHGAQLQGTMLEDQPMIVTLAAPNLTTGQGGIGGDLNDADFIRAIRHGVKPDGRGLMIMHSDIFHNLSEQDLGDVIAYVKSVPPVDHELPKNQARVLGRILIPLGVFDSPGAPLLPAELIDQNAPFAQMPAQGVTAGYGRYLMSITLCRLCHGPDLAGGKDPDPSVTFISPNLTPGGELGTWTEAQFVNTLRTGATPHGHKLDPDLMPWKIFGKMTDAELQAIWLYLHSLPALEQYTP